MLTWLLLCFHISNSKCRQCFDKYTCASKISFSYEIKQIFFSGNIKEEKHLLVGCKERGIPRAFAKLRGDHQGPAVEQADFRR